MDLALFMFFSERKRILFFRKKQPVNTSLAAEQFRVNKVKISLKSRELYEFIVFYPRAANGSIRPDFIVSEEDQWARSTDEMNLIKNFTLGFFFGVSIILALINFFHVVL